MKINFNNKPTQPDELNGLKVNYAPTQRPFAKWRFKVVLVVFLLPFITYAIYIAYNFIVVRAPGFILLKEMKIQAPQEGKVTFLTSARVDIKKGDTLAILTNELLEIEYTNYRKKINYNEKDIRENIRNNQTALNMSKDFYYDRLHELQRVQKYRKRGTMSELEVSNARIQLEGAKLAFTNAKNTLQNSKVAFKDLYVDKIKLEQLKVQLDSLLIKSSVNGFVGELYTIEGELINKGDTILSLNMHGTTEVEVFLNPKYAKYATIGREVTVRLPENIHINGVISDTKMKALRTPNGLKSAFSQNHYSIVLIIETEEKIPKKYIIDHLPIEVHFSLFH